MPPVPTVPLLLADELLINSNFGELRSAVGSLISAWQQYQDSNLAELARQKVAAERRAERADATLLSVYDGARARTVLSNLASRSPSAYAACCLRSSCVHH